jgi:hypothetical protein
LRQRQLQLSAASLRPCSSISIQRQHQPQHSLRGGMRSAYASTSAPALSDSATAVAVHQFLRRAATAPLRAFAAAASPLTSASTTSSDSAAACICCSSFSFNFSFCDEQRQRRCVHLLQQFQL